MANIQVGSTITNGTSVIRITQRVGRDRRYRGPGWRGIDIPLNAGSAPRRTDFIPDYLVRNWTDLPFEWRSIGGGMSERYVWTPDNQRLRRELRKTEVKR